MSTVAIKNTLGTGKTDFPPSPMAFFVIVIRLK